MPFKNRQKRLDYLRAWRAKNAEHVRTQKHAYYLAHRDEFAARRVLSTASMGTREGAFETEKLQSSRALARWRDVPGEARLPVRLGRPRNYLGTKPERRAQALAIYRAKKRAKRAETVERAEVGP